MRKGERKSRVIELHIKNPDWPAAKIAAKAGCMTEYVVACKHRYGLKIPNERAEKGTGIAALGMTARKLGLTREDLERIAAERELV